MNSKKKVCPNCSNKGKKTGKCKNCFRAFCIPCGGAGYTQVTSHKNGRRDEFRYTCRNCKGKGFTR